MPDEVRYLGNANVANSSLTNGAVQMYKRKPHKEPPYLSDGACYLVVEGGITEPFRAMCLLMGLSVLVIPTL